MRGEAILRRITQNKGSILSIKEDELQNANQSWLKEDCLLTYFSACLAAIKQ
jgi:hypothetical protein